MYGDLKITFKGVNEANRKLAQVGVSLDKIIDEWLDESGKLAETKMKDNSPVDTGRLRDSIRRSKLSGRRMRVGPDLRKANYAPFVELGHHLRNGKWLPGQKFVLKTWQEVRVQVKNDLRDKIAKAVNKK
jgi:HK97 gp10 family phage protein